MNGGAEESLPGETRESRLASGWTVESGPRQRVEPAAELTEIDPDHVARTGDDETGPEAMTSAALVMLGVMGGLYLLYTWVWLSWAQYYATMNAEIAEASGAIGGFLQQLVFWLSPLAPGLWFLCTVLIQRGKSTWRLALWLIIGAAVLIPLPALTGGAA